MLKLYEQYDSKTFYPLQEKQCYLKSKTQPWTNVFQMFLKKKISNLSLIFLPLIKLWRFFATWRDHVSVIVHFEFLDNTVSPAIAFGRYPHAPSLTHNPPMRRTKNKMMNKIAHHLMSTCSSRLNKHSFVF